MSDVDPRVTVRGQQHFKYKESERRPRPGGHRGVRADRSGASQSRVRTIREHLRLEADPLFGREGRVLLPRIEDMPHPEVGPGRPTRVGLAVSAGRRAWLSSRVSLGAGTPGLRSTHADPALLIHQVGDTT